MVIFNRFRPKTNTKSIIQPSVLGFLQDYKSILVPKFSEVLHIKYY